MPRHTCDQRSVLPNLAAAAERHAALQGTNEPPRFRHAVDWLNLMMQIITIGDYPKAETRKFFRERMLPNVPERLRPSLDFDKLYEAFGGKLAHWQDYITDYGEF